MWLRGWSQLSSQKIIWPKADRGELSSLNDLTTTSIRTSQKTLSRTINSLSTESSVILSNIRIHSSIKLYQSGTTCRKTQLALPAMRASNLLSDTINRFSLSLVELKPVLVSSTYSNRYRNGQSLDLLVSPLKNDRP